MPRPGRLTRPILLIAMWLLIGAVLNVGVTWVLAGLGPHRFAAPVLHVFRFPRPWPAPVPAEWPFPTQSLERRSWWTHEMICSTIGHEVRIRVNEETVIDLMYAQSNVVGWPCASMRAWWRHALTTAPEMVQEEHAGLLFFLPTWMTKSPVALQLPTVAIWPEFAVNSMFYGGIAWLLICGPNAFRRWHRRRAGRCLSCGYDRAGIATTTPCPECGRR